MRLFVALELPEAVREEAGRRMSSRKGRLPHARWTHPDNLHLTLVFLGEVGEEELPALRRALAAAFAAHRPLTLKVADAGTFPPQEPPAGKGDGGAGAGPGRGGRSRGRRSRPAKVAWVGIAVEEGIGRLRALQRSVDAACRQVLDLPPERRPYSPHLTLARPRKPWRHRAAADFVEAFHAPLGEPFRVEAGHLVRSELGAGPGGGSRYSSIAAFPLATESPTQPPDEPPQDGDAPGEEGP